MIQLALSCLPRMPRCLVFSRLSMLSARRRKAARFSAAKPVVGAALVFAEANVHDPMHFVLHAPVAANGAGKGFNTQGW